MIRATILDETKNLFFVRETESDVMRCDYCDKVSVTNLPSLDTDELDNYCSSHLEEYLENEPERDDVPRYRDIYDPSTGELL